MLFLEGVSCRKHHFLEVFFCIFDDSLPSSFRTGLIFFIQFLNLVISESFNEFLVEVESTQVWLKWAALLLQQELAPVNGREEGMRLDVFELVVVT